jgi:hypothetical protein
MTLSFIGLTTIVIGQIRSRLVRLFSMPESVRTTCFIQRFLLS